MIRSTPLRIALVLIAATATACATSSRSATEETGATPSGRRDRTLITADDLKEVPSLNLYEAVQRLHPEWLVVRNQTSVSGRNMATASGQAGVQVYMDTQLLGNAEMLRQINVSAASSLRYYSASDAQSRFGVGNTAGAIQVMPALTRR